MLGFATAQLIFVNIKANNINILIIEQCLEEVYEK